MIKTTNADRQLASRIIAGYHRDAEQKRARLKRAITEGEYETIEAYSRTLAVDLLQIALLEDLIEEIHIEALIQAEACDALALPNPTDEEMDRYAEQYENGMAAVRSPRR